MPFSEQRLDLGIVYGTVSTYRYSTTILANSAGQEQRNANWSEPLGRFQLGNRTLDRTDLDTLIQFHKDRKGSLDGFRFKDWIDYRAVAQPIGVGDGVTQQYQLIKTYTVENFSSKRPITKPVEGTVAIYLNGVVATAFTLDFTNGLLTFPAPPANGTLISADFEFDVPVRFETDEIATRFEAYDSSDRLLYSLYSLTLTEIRVPSGLPVPPSPTFPDLGILLDLGYDYGTVGGNRYQTLITAVNGGNERRDAQWNEPLGRWNVGDRTLDRAGLDYLIAFFRCCRGAASSFRYYDWAQSKEIQVRFESDSISLRYDAIDLDAAQAIYGLSGVPLMQTLQCVSANYQLFTSGQLYTVPEFCRCFEFSRIVEDFEFKTSNWMLHFQIPNNGGSVQATQQAIGGNTGAYRKVISIFNPATNLPTYITSLHIYNQIIDLSIESFTYINYSFDRTILYISSFGEPGLTLAIVQNNKIYTAPDQRDSLLNWHKIKMENLESDDFYQIGNLTQGSSPNNLEYNLNINNHPDFTKNGDFIKFGLISLDVHITQNIGNLELQTGIDNFKVEIFKKCP